MDEPEITIIMSREDWKMFRNALRAYTPTEEERPRYTDLSTWIDTDWDHTDAKISIHGAVPTDKKDWNE